MVDTTNPEELKLTPRKEFIKLLPGVIFSFHQPGYPLGLFIKGASIVGSPDFYYSPLTSVLVDLSLKRRPPILFHPYTDTRSTHKAGDLGETFVVWEHFTIEHMLKETTKTTRTYKPPVKW